MERFKLKIIYHQKSKSKCMQMIQIKIKYNLMLTKTKDGFVWTIQLYQSLNLSKMWNNSLSLINKTHLIFFSTKKFHMYHPIINN